MKNLEKNNTKIWLYKFLPTILLFFSVLNEFDFNNLEFKYFSFNFSYILIFHYSLKRSESFGFITIFIAGLFNDVIAGSPMGISSLAFLLLCGAAAYLRNITLRPNLIKDWFFFFITILVINSLSFMLLTLIFNYEINYLDQLINVMCTFLLYFIFSRLFSLFDDFILGGSNAR